MFITGRHLLTLSTIISSSRMPSISNPSKSIDFVSQQATLPKITVSKSPCLKIPSSQMNIWVWSPRKSQSQPRPIRSERPPFFDGWKVLIVGNGPNLHSATEYWANLKLLKVALGNSPEKSKKPRWNAQLRATCDKALPKGSVQLYIRVVQGLKTLSEPHQHWLTTIWASATNDSPLPWPALHIIWGLVIFHTYRNGQLLELKHDYVHLPHILLDR